MVTVQGVWIFKDRTPFTPPEETMVQNVKFTTVGGVECQSIEIKNGIDCSPVLLNFDGHTVAVFDSADFLWLEQYPEYRTVNFGKTEQTVSDEFYSFLQQIATPRTQLSLAEKLVLIAENEQWVYDAGYAAGQSAGDDGYYDAFWDAFQQNGTRTNYQYAFAYGWDDETYRPKIIPKPVGQGTANYMFQKSKITRIDLTNFDGTEITSSTGIFTGADAVTYLEVDFPLCTSLANSLYQLSALKTIVLHNLNGCMLGGFIGAKALENVTFNGTFGGEYMEMLQSDLLTYESLQNVIEAAYDYAADPDDKTHRVGLHATAKAKLTEADIAKLTQKGWTLT